MKQWFYGEKRQRFSFRKLSVGLVSATIGSFFFSSLIAGDLSPVKATEISHGQSAQVSYYYVMESELTEAEKSILIRDIPKHVEEISESYYLVYRPKDQKLGYGALPQTGYSGVWESIFAVAGFTFLVLIFARAKSGKRYLSSILLVTGMGSVLLSPTALAVTNLELAAYNQSINLGVGESLPKPLQIDGFEYIGYLKNEDNKRNILYSSHKDKSLVDYGTNPDTAPVHEVLELDEYGTSPAKASVHEVPELVDYGTSPSTAPVHDVPELVEYGTSPDTAPVHEVPELDEYGTSPSTAPVHEVPELDEYGTSPSTAPVHEIPELDEYGTSPSTAPVHEVPELVDYGTNPSTSPVHEAPELDEYGTSPSTSPVHEAPELDEYGTSPDTAPVHEVPELVDYGTSPATAPVHEVPELDEYGTSPSTAPVHEIPELVDYGTNPDTSPVHEVPELDEYGMSPSTAPVHEVPELVGYGTNPSMSPVHEAPELDEYGTSPSTAPVHEVPELDEYGTSLSTAPVHEVPELDEYGTSPSTAPVYEVPELDEYGTSPSTAPVHEVPELVDYGMSPSTAPVHEVPELDEYGTSPSTAPVYELPELDEYGTSPDTAPVHEVPELKFSINDIIRMEKIDFSIVELYTDEITEGTRNIATPGVQGERTIKTRIYSSNGQEIDRQELSNEETLSPVTQVVKVGTAKPTMIPNESPTAESLLEYPLTFTDEIRVDKINFAVREEETDELVQGSRNIVTPGVQGERRIKTRIYSSNGQEIDRQELSNEETLSPVTQVVKVGTAKPAMVPNDAPQAASLEEFDLITLHNLLTEATQIKAEARYFNDDQSHQSNYDSALMAAQAILTQSQASQAEINQLVEQIKQAKAQLSGLEVVKTALQTEYDLNVTVKTSAKYKNADSDKKTVYIEQLAKSEIVLNSQTATQVQVNQVLASLQAAKEALNGVPKVKPTVSILSLTENADDKSVTVQYRLEDQTKSFRSAIAELYQGDKLVRTLPITNFDDSLKIGELDYYTAYTLKTKLTYELDNGSFTEFETDSRDFELEYKKISFRDVDSVEFYSKDNGQYKRLVSMSSMPKDLSNYFVKVKSSEAKEMLLPVHSISEIQKDGKDVYRVTVSLPELVQEGETGYKSGYDFYISKSVSSQQNVYTSFSGLIDAMKKNMASNYVLGADLDASEVSLAPADYVYLRGNFTGSLTGNHNGKQYAIYNLAKPLFENLKSGSSVSGIDLKDVNIVGSYDSAALARSAENARITDVSVQGKVSVIGNASNVAGLVVSATNTQISNSSFTGVIQANEKQGKEYNVGGLVANLKGGDSLLSQSRADVTILAGARANNQRFGGLVGRLENNARISRSYVTGKIQNTTKNGQIGGIVGSNYFNGLVDNVISNISGTNVYSISGDQAYNNDRITEAYAVEGNQTLENDKFVTSTLTLNEAEEKLASLDITTNLEDTNLNLYSVNYAQEKNARENRLIAYSNMEKLLPFYNKETIISYGNKLPDHHKLNTEYLLDVVPMKGDQIITDINSNKASIDRLMLHFEDNTVDYLNLTYKGEFKNQAIAEYSVNGLDLLYTPEAFLSDYSRVLNQVLPELNKVVLDSPAMRTVLGVNADTSLDDLYLDTSFEQVKTKLSEELRKVLAMDKSINTEGNVVADYVAHKITANKEAFLLGLTYLNRWYNINYDNINVKDLSAYKFDFFGNHSASTIDTIISLGQSGMNNLKAKNNHLAYDASLSEATGKRGLFNYLENYRQIFLPYKTNNEWLKTNTKAYIVESKSDIAEARKLQDTAEGKSKYSVGVYDKITADNWEYKGMLLPLLTMSEKGVYVISNMSTISMGAYDRYRDVVDGKVRTDAELVEYVEDRVRKSAEYQRDHYDFWYKILSPESRDKLFRSVLVYDGFLMKDRTGQRYWAPANDKKSLAMQEFFGPAGKWYPSKGYNAYATGSVTHFDAARLLEDYGNSVYTHEMTHNSDGGIYFEGNGRREGLGAELYARGLLQSTPTPDEPTITLNTLFKVDKDSKTRMHTYNFKERVQNAADLQHYVHGMFDMIYTLDYLEGTSMLKQSDDAKLQWFRKMENYYITDKYGNETHAGNQTRTFTAEEIKQLTSFYSLIENDVITRRENKDNGKYGRNGYLSLSLFSPIYSALSNPNGAPGDVMFRRTAYELLAAKGYHEGFVPYVSGKYSKEAFDEGKKTWDGWSGRDVGLVTDQKVLENVFKGEYDSWVAFKKAMYKERIDQLTKLKPITIEYELRNPNSTKKVTIRSYAQMQKLMDEAVAEDVGNITNATSRVDASWVNLLKKKIYNAYLRETDDFRQSIFKK